MKVYICLVLILGLATMTSATKAFLKNKDVWSQGGDRNVDNTNVNFSPEFILNENKQALLNKDWSKEHSVSLSDSFSKTDDDNSQSVSISICLDVDLSDCKDDSKGGWGEGKHRKKRGGKKKKFTGNKY